jgi:hypothetical protein
MKTMFKLAILLIFAITISCDSETLSDPDGAILASKSANAKQVTKDFTNSYTGTATGFYGIMTHVGNYTGVDVKPFIFEFTGDLTGIQYGFEKITAANGDEIWTESTTYITFVDDGTYLNGTYTGTWVITGGTGRFAGATGSATVNNGVFDEVGSHHNSVGTITY